MARKFGPFDTSVFYEVENRRLQRAFNPATGFVRTGQGAVTAGTGAQLVIAAYPDGALIDGMYVENPSSETVTLTTNTASTNPRIDRLVMRLDMTAKTIAPVQIVGTPASSPSAPSLTNTSTVVDMPLCQYRFPGSASAQNPGSIIDERVYSGIGEWTSLGILGPWFIPYTESGTYVPDVQYRVEGRRVFLRGYMQCASAVNAGAGITSGGAIPTGIRPAYNTPLYAGRELFVPVRLEVKAAGTLTSYRAMDVGTFLSLDGLSWPIG